MIYSHVITIHKFHQICFEDYLINYESNNPQLAKAVESDRLISFRAAK